jgi:phospholipase C
MTTVHDVDMSHGPMGLGMRVPLIVISPFSRNPTPKAGPLVCSDLNDHTSLLRFIESWSHAIGKPAPIPDRDPSRKQPGLSPWRRATVGDLSTSLNLSGTPDASVPTDLLSAVPNPASPAVLTECTLTGTVASEVSSTSPIVQDPVIPTVLSLPIQEPFVGVVQRVEKASCPAPAAARSSAGGSSGGRSAASSPPTAPASPAPGRLPATGALPVSATDAMVVGLAAVAAFALRRRVSGPPD